MQGSDTKLIDVMQPYHEARGQHPRDLRGHRVPPDGVSNQRRREWRRDDER
jgi:hypothetical protein